jgi:putative two-component system response regulator
MPSVLLVDDEPHALEALAAILEDQGFDLHLAASPSAAISALSRRVFDAVVTDVVFDGCPDGAEVLRAARNLQPGTLVILMTGYPALDAAVSAIKGGAFDYLQKPVDPVLLGARIHRALRERACDRENLDFTELAEIVSGMVANTIERIDPYTAGHGQRTRRYCDLLAQAVGVDVTTREKLQLAAIAHDYGKIYLDDLGFLTKKGPLTASEYREVQRHPSLGAEKLGNHGRLREVCRWIAEHHEKWDGSGYPARARGEAISLPGRILGVVEVFDSLATRRSYKEPWELTRVLDYFESQCGRAFDPAMLAVFMPMLEQHGLDWLRQPELDRQASGLPEAATASLRAMTGP